MWFDAMDEEIDIDSFDENYTFELVELAKGKKALLKK